MTGDQCYLWSDVSGDREATRTSTSTLARLKIELDQLCCPEVSVSGRLDSNETEYRFSDDVRLNCKISPRLVRSRIYLYQSSAGWNIILVTDVL